MNRKIAIITARGGSKRIPHKNIKEFCGKPIISYSIEAAIKSKLFDTVMVSTDDEEIANISRKYGADVPFLRSAETSDDFSTTADVLEEVLGKYCGIGKEYKVAVCIYPTAPFITADKLITAYNLLTDDVDSVIPVVPFSFPPQRSFVKENEFIKYKYPEFERVRSQDIEPLYHDCGQFYIFKVNMFLKYKTIVMPNSVPLIIPETEVQDIDNESDWKLAEMKYRLLYEQSSSGMR